MAVISLARTRIHKYTKDVFFISAKLFFLRRDGKPSFAYLFCPKSDLLDEFTDTHHTMTRILFVYS